MQQMKSNNRIKPMLFFGSLFSFVAVLLSLYSCNNSTDNTPKLSCSAFEVQNFIPVTNYQSDSLLSKTIYLDYNNAMDGFYIPSVSQTADGNFTFTFEIKNTTSQAQKFYYKIYYQNESYKFPERDSVTGKEHAFAEENFYGSWEATDITFKETEAISADNEFHVISDKFRIVGNPRNEQRYFSETENDRWKRNPRVGNYQFMLVISTADDLKSIPDEIKNIALKSKEHFSNPYYYYDYADGKKLKNTIVYRSENLLNVKAQPNLGNGIYINDHIFKGDYDKSYFCETCGSDSIIYKNAPFQQFVNYVDASTKMDNIPVLADILKDNYSKMDYNWNKNFYTKEELIPTLIQTSKKPCQTVFSDAKENKIIIKNPATKFGEWKKESVGVITRHGFTYGKYRVKVKLTELLNKNGVWNGLTNAIWLITQGGGEWNYRRNCNKEGYMASYWGGNEDKRVPAVDYSEIDFEILKTAPYCPDNCFPPVYKNTKADNKNTLAWNVPMPDDITANDSKVTVACTNWDMACQEPKNFGVGCKPLVYKGKTYYTHRWDHWYRALNERQMEEDDELFAGEFYYFEIDWRPTEIIWRIGPSPDKMREVGYMNETVTSIPNNQMLLIITQEYHNTKWWPGTPYSQDNLPFPLNDIKGEIYELVIE
jgi:hypothetical protein